MVDQPSPVPPPQPNQSAAIGTSNYSWLDITERIVKLLSLVAIPIVIPIALAIYSARVQATSQKETIDRDYVQLAVSVLEQKKNDVDSGLRDWAVDLLDEHSPTKFTPEVIANLKSGAVSLPTAYPSSSISATSLNGQWMATAKQGRVDIINSQTGTVIASIGTTGTVVDLNFSPDDRSLLIASDDGSISIMKTATAQVISRLQVTPPIVTASFMVSGDIQVVSREGDRFYTPDGKLTTNPLNLPLDQNMPGIKSLNPK